ncbi:MAG: hypothetical protein Q8K82_04795 [Gemmatimonadaceae bacterium]|nr:hypothetical protein [Gemmatimonadaceae bacterium]
MSTTALRPKHIASSTVATTLAPALFGVLPGAAVPGDELDAAGSQLGVELVAAELLSRSVG